MLYNQFVYFTAIGKPDSHNLMSFGVIYLYIACFALTVRRRLIPHDFIFVDCGDF